MEIPRDQNLAEIIDSLNTISPSVLYAHPNFFAHPNSTNDPFYEDDQGGLHFTDALGMDEIYHINIEPVWDELGEVGKSFVKTGVFDNSFAIHHEDFLYNQGNDQSSVIVAGWEFDTEVDLFNTDINPVAGGNGHGTANVGVIAAVRNNEKGVAGIAGGDRSSSGTFSDRGASIYALKTAGTQEPSSLNYFEMSLEYLADAIVMSAISDPENITYKYGLHIQNHTWYISPNLQYWNDLSINVLQNAIHFVNRTGTIFLAGRGNVTINGNWQDQWFVEEKPACYHDTWVIGVGGSNDNGQWDISGAKAGCDLDLVAPSKQGLSHTPTNNGVNLNDLYIAFSGTSNATPMVSGVVALMLSYENLSEDSPENLAPEDVENLLQETAQDIFDGDEYVEVGYDDYTGHGLVSACAVMKTLENNDVLHFDNQDNNDGELTTNQLLEEDIAIELTNDWEDLIDNTVYPADNYIMDVYEINSTIDHDFLPSMPLQSYWPIHSISNTMILYQDGQLDPIEAVTIESLDVNQALLKGYAYHLKNIDGSSIGWIPFDILNNPSEVTMAYSTLVGTGIINGNVGPCYLDLVDVVDQIKVIDSFVQILPNPAENKHQIQFNST